MTLIALKHQRMAGEVDQDRRAALERGLAGVQRHETAAYSADTAPPLAGSLRGAVRDAILRVILDGGSTVTEMADAAIRAMADYPHRGRK